jgi:hypothetical protein
MSKFVDLSGQRFGFWTVQKRVDNNKKGQVQWQCLCDCGTTKNVTANSLKSYNSTSCGCNHSPNLTDAEFGELKVVKLDSSSDKKRRYWLCQCSCGTNIIVSTYRLRNNLISSCGHNTLIQEPGDVKKENFIDVYIRQNKIFMEQNKMYIEQNKMYIEQNNSFILRNQLCMQQISKILRD